MSHDIYFSTGVPAMAYVREKPWHGLGEALPANQSFEEWVRAARLDWKIQMSPVRYVFNDRAVHMHGRFVLARSGSAAPLDIVQRPKVKNERTRYLTDRERESLLTAYRTSTKTDLFLVVILARQKLAINAMRLIIRNENVTLAIDKPVSREVVQPVCGEESVGVYTPPFRLISFGPGNLAAYHAQLTARHGCYQLHQVRCYYEE